MKRSVAIHGMTPAFLRWAIWHPCELRPLEPRRFADQTFRVLRGVRELSIAKAERRCTPKYCFHPSSIENADSADSEDGVVLGFRRAEVAAAFGGEDRLESSCHGCAANALSEQIPGASAGCFGFLSTTEFDLQKLLSGYSQAALSKFDLVSAIQNAASNLNLETELESVLGSGRMVWNRLWKNKILTAKQLKLVAKLFDRVAADFTDVLPRHVQVFRAAVKACLANQYPLHVELVPSGFSDGQTWSLNASCPDCGFEPTKIKKLQKCIGCGRIGGTSEGPKFRVLGIRPYSHLAGIIGEKQARKEVSRLT
jgi:hypothetical protein